MFKLINNTNDANALSLVEDLINISPISTYTHLVYCDEHVEFITVLANTAPEYFTTTGWYKYISDNLDKLQFIDGRAVYQIINLPMVKNEHYIDIGSLKDQNKQLTQQIAELKAELKLMQEVNLFTNVLFASVYPKWENEAEFKSLANYKYISLVLNNVVDSFDSNFGREYILGFYNSNGGNQGGGGLAQPIQIYNIFNLSRIVPPINSDCGGKLAWNLFLETTAAVCRILSIYQLFERSYETIGDMVYMYIIGVIAGYIHLNIDKILPYEYLIFIDIDVNGISFKLVTTKKHEIPPKRFLYDWRRFIVNGVKH